MDSIIKTAIKSLGESSTLLDKKNLTRMYKEFPIPKEYNILWADVAFSTRSSGVVFTDKALVVRADKATLKEYNASVSNKKDKQSSIYHMIKWEYFNVDDFKVENIDGNIFVCYNGNPILRTQNAKFKTFTGTYTNEYMKFVKVTAVVDSNLAAAVESVFAETNAKINDMTGHGITAEEVNTMLDNLAGRNAQRVGQDNAKNGADRIVDGVHIQSKYYSTGKRSVGSCFDPITKQYKYFNADGSPMVVEVPKDKYFEAVAEFRKRILEGKVPGVTNPDDATKYVKRGNLTHQQALNLCKAGTIESLTYDSATGAVTCSFAFGLTFLATFALVWQQTGNKKTAMNEALIAGVQVFGLSFVNHVITSQVARTGLTKSLMPVSDYIVGKLGYKATQAIVNALRNLAGKVPIYGAAATKSLSKILRGNVVTSTITFIVFSIPDTHRVFNKKISKAQYTKNMLSLMGAMIGGGGGALAAGLAAGKIGAVAGSVKPVVGTAIGFAGGVVGGVAVGTGVKLAGDAIREDDTIIIARMFNAITLNLVYEYLLQEHEIDVLIEKLNAVKPKQFKKLFGEVHACENQEEVITNFLRVYFDDIVSQRPRIATPTLDDIADMMSDFAQANEEEVTD